jgi:hypothetical protein
MIYVIMQNDFPVAATRYGDREARALCDKLEAEAIAEVRRNYPERARYCPNNIAGYWRVYEFEDALAKKNP